MHPVRNTYRIEFLIQLNQNCGITTNMTSSVFITQHCGLVLNSCERNDSVNNIAGLHDCEIHKKLFRKWIASTEPPPIKYNNGVTDLYLMLHSKIFTWNKKHTYRQKEPLTPF